VHSQLVFQTISDVQYLVSDIHKPTYMSIKTKQSATFEENALIFFCFQSVTQEVQTTFRVENFLASNPEGSNPQIYHQPL
jgi:hypothetical protein